MKRLLLIYNAKSGKAQINSKLSNIIDIFVKADYRVEVRPTQARLDARDQVLNYSKEFDLVVCSGGDGTLSEVISGIVPLDKKPILGYIPSGSTNDFASSIKLPKNMENAAKLIVKGNIKEVDVGHFNTKSFIYIAAFGAFTDVSYMTKQEMKNVLGHQAYILEGIKKLSSLRTYKMKMQYGKNIIEGDYLFGMVSNSLSAGGFKGITGDKVLLDDGLYEVTLIKAPKNPIEMKDIILTLIGFNKKCDNVITFKTRCLRILSYDKAPWVLDGEYGGAPKKIKIINEQKAIKIITGQY